MADHKRALEERLREVCCIGDETSVQQLVQRGVNFNAPNAMNGWTPLHWAAKRGHINIVKYLLQEGVDTTVLTNKGETAAQLSSDAGIKHMLGEEEGEQLNTGSEALPIVPNYLRNPEFFYAQKASGEGRPKKWGRSEQDDSSRGNKDYTFTNNNHEDVNFGPNTSFLNAQSGQEIVLKLRIADCEDGDFIEVDFHRSSLTYQNLETVFCEELGIEAKNIKKIRKLPNTIVRNDRDMKRLQPFQELEVVLAKGQTS